VLARFRMPLAVSRTRFEASRRRTRDAFLGMIQKTSIVCR
jgi:hypothetical protein